MPDERPGGPWTRHGHAVLGVTIAGSGRPPVARCGGPRLCTKCTADAVQLQAAAFLAAREIHVTDGTTCWCDPIIEDYRPEHNRQDRGGAMSLTAHQAHALKLLRKPDRRGDPKSAEVTGGHTWADDYTVWVNHQTAKALERRGLVRIARDEDWTIYLTPDGYDPACGDGSNLVAAMALIETTR